MDHWRRGHKQICKEIHRGGNAEKYHADKKYKEAVAVAVKKCAADTKGHTCYICTEAVHWKTKEGLVRMCACRGTSGFAHVSCLAEQAKILCDEAEKNNLGLKAINKKLERWYACGLCEQYYHGVVYCALGWACWKTYVGRPETDTARRMAISVLALGLFDARQYKDALSVQEAELSMLRRIGAAEENILVAQGNLANTYQNIGRNEDALRMRKIVYSRTLRLHGEEYVGTLVAANNCAAVLAELKRFPEAKALLRKVIPVAQRVFGQSHEGTFKMRWIYARALCEDAGATLDDLNEAVTTLEDIERTARRVLGGAHPTTMGIERSLQNSRAELRDAMASREI